MENNVVEVYSLENYVSLENSLFKILHPQFNISAYIFWVAKFFDSMDTILVIYAKFIYNWFKIEYSQT